MTEKAPPDDIAAVIARLVRAERGRLLSVLIGALKDFQLAEDCLQDAFEAALVHWRRSGLPHSPEGWLVAVARRKAIDRLRRAANFAGKSDEIAFLLENAMAGEGEEIGAIADERLKLVFICCHPALERKTAVALTLRSVLGLSTEDVAAAFLDMPSAMAQRLVRARHKIARAGIAFAEPEPEDFADRLSGVLAVIYLAFNEGYAASGAERLRVDLCEEAIRLARLLAELVPGEAEIEGLVSLMLLHHARSDARTAEDGMPLTLEEQDRRRWRAHEIAEGTAILHRALRRGRPGHYQLQAAIAALHAEAPSFAETDWRQIELLYRVLAEGSDNPVHELNRIAALSHLEGAGPALLRLKAVAPALTGYQPFHALHADLLAKIGAPEAADAYRRAIALSSSEPERRFLQARLEALPKR
ncbi:RNA polymerase sigma factor [Martelella limonii]|uniref:RNA polymerase sigma factor n=1 Tax=Martelella limonii TaxID=1647649 RepID=UPI0031407423